MHRKQPTAILAVVSAALLASACAGAGSPIAAGTAGSGGSGQAGSGGQGGSGVAGTGVTQPPASGLHLFGAPCQPSPITVGGSPVRRISRVEYDNMVRDLGLDPGGTEPARQFVSEQKIDTGRAGNFNTNSYATISGTLINQQYLQAAEALATAAVAGNLAGLVSCATRNAACAQQFIASFAGRAFRGQLDDAEAAALLALYTTVSGQFDFVTGIQAVIESVLTSPRFLFVLEFGQPDPTGAAKAVALAPTELATRLALYLWRSLPDQALLDAASGGHLASAADVATQATRMLADGRAKDALQDFADQWLDIENMDAVTKDTKFTKWSAGVAQDMHTETLTTFTAAVLGGQSYTALLTSPQSHINGNLASFYGVGGSPSFDAATTVDTAANPRKGILTQGSVLAAHSHTTLMSPTKRGRMIRQQILCEEVPDPPPMVNNMPIPPPPDDIKTGTTRDAYLQHVQANSACNGCHQWMDWLGFGFDNYDASGAYITQELGNPVDPSGKFVAMNATDITGSFTNAADMIGQLSASQQVNQCFALEQMRYALLRSETDADACSAQQIYQAFSSGGFDLQKLLVAIVSSNSFMYRTPVNVSGSCQ